MNQGKTFSEKWKNFLLKVKNFFSDKLNCLYVISLVLQTIFIIIQFVPSMLITTAVGIWGAHIEKLSFYGFCSHETQGEMKIIFWAFIVAFIFSSFVTCIKYFVLKTPKRYGKFWRLQLALMFFLSFFIITVVEGLDMAARYANYGAEFTLLGGGVFYILVSCTLSIVYFLTSRLSKEQKEREAVEVRVQEELRKKEEIEQEK